MRIYDYTFYRISDDGAPMKCVVCGVRDSKPKVKTSTTWGAQHPECVVDGLDKYQEVEAPK